MNTDFEVYTLNVTVNFREIAVGSGVHTMRVLRTGIETSLKTVWPPEK